MNFKLVFLALLFLPILGQSQTLSLLTDLDSDIEETSGLIYINSKIITHNDSGDSSHIYEVNPSTGNPSRIVNVVNTYHNDWEDICSDEEFIYIGDFGNNNGTRNDLRILKISRADYFDNDTVVVAEFINFNYAEQTNFNFDNYTNFDAEALISIGDSLYIFTKNRGDFKSNVYAISKEPGDYEVSIKETYNIQGLITGATYAPQYDQILLSGYSFSSTFVVVLSEFTDSFFFNGNYNRKELPIPTGFSNQIESIAYINGNQFYMSGEETDFAEEALYLLNISDINNLDNVSQNEVRLYPNPVTDIMCIDDVEPNSEFYIYDALGKLEGKGVILGKEINVQNLISGTYILSIVSGKSIKNSKFVKK